MRPEDRVCANAAGVLRPRLGDDSGMVPASEVLLPQAETKPVCALRGSADAGIDGRVRASIRNASGMPLAILYSIQTG